jgi:hypothetical protein
MAAIDWDAAGTPVSLRDTVTGLDNGNTARLLTAIRRASGEVCR